MKCAFFVYGLKPCIDFTTKGVLTATVILSSLSGLMKFFDVPISISNVIFLPTTAHSMNGSREF